MKRWHSPKRERLAEDMRLLYVGLTRAAHLCVLGVGDARYGQGSASELGRSAIGHLIEAGPGDGEAAAAIARLGALPGAALIDADSLPFATLTAPARPPPRWRRAASTPRSSVTGSRAAIRR
jgi:exodeoxyribonuclease V beta subunit